MTDVYNYLQQYGYPNAIVEVIDRVSTHLLTQNEKAINTETEACRYRVYNADGKTLMCAVGCLIPDENYSGNLEGSIITDVFVRKALPERYQKEEVYKVLHTLQRIHDSLTPNQWPAALYTMQNLYGVINDMTLYRLRQEGAII